VEVGKDTHPTPTKEENKMFKPIEDTRPLNDRIPQIRKGQIIELYSTDSRGSSMLVATKNIQDIEQVKQEFVKQATTKQKVNLYQFVKFLVNRNLVTIQQQHYLEIDIQALRSQL